MIPNLVLLRLMTPTKVNISPLYRVIIVLAYDTLSYKPNIRKTKGLNYRKKQNHGRKTPVRINFSTLNTASNRTPFATQPSLNFAYTGVSFFCFESSKAVLVNEKDFQFLVQLDECILKRDMCMARFYLFYCSICVLLDRVEKL